MEVWKIQRDSDCLSSLRNISEALKGKQNVTVSLEQGIYHWRDPAAERDFGALMEGRLDYDTHWGRPGLPYNQGVVFDQVNGLTLDGNGSTLTIHGLLAPFTFQNCQRVTLRNFRIDWDRPLFSVGTVLSWEEGEITVKIDDDFPVRGGEPVWALMDYDRFARRFGLIWKYRNMSAMEQIEPQTVRIRAKLGQPLTPGTTLILRHVGNYRPCIHLWECEKVLMENVILHANPGMGVTAHYCRDLRFRGLQVRPAEDRLMSTNTDATHFITCSGTIDFENCYFEGMGDDAVNVHGFYNRITQVVDDHTVTATIDNENGTQDLRYDAPRPGDMAQFCDPRTLLPIWESIVRESRVDEEAWQVTLVLADPLPKEIAPSVVFTKCSDTAALRVVNCHVNRIRARAFLSQTKAALIEGCRIEHCTGTAIHVNAALGWCESIPCENVVIRDNRIRDCGYGDATFANACAVTVQTKCREKAVGVHGHVEIVDNEVTGSGRNGIVLSSLEKGQVMGNRFWNCDAAVVVESCGEVELSHNRYNGSRVVFSHGSSPLTQDNEEDDYVLPEL